MRTNIDIEDGLIAEAMAVTGLPTKKAAVEEALRRLVRRYRQHEAIRDMAGRDMAGLGWDGDLDTLRGGRDAEPGQ